MDLDIIFWIAIAAIYLLQGLIGRKKPQHGPGGPSQGGPDPSAESSPDMDSALEEIRSILTGEPLRRPEPEMQDAPAKSRGPVQEVEMPPAHWETFEQMDPEPRPKRKESPKVKPASKPYPKLTVKELSPGGDTEDAWAEKHAATVQPATDIAAMRKAVVLSEILRPPVSKRRY
jgi:hypothetical protein